ncbi:MAG: sugar nucleotide-binding protein, partial [Methylococcaceae bacterium]|nr:sugar nucleotide-binding protein [Methylococcaceae bacterium]
RSLQKSRFSPGENGGIYHLSCGGQASWCEFARSIREKALEEGMLTETCARIEPIASVEYPTPAKRPAYSVLSNDKLAENFGMRLPDWREALSLCLEESRH